MTITVPSSISYSNIAAGDVFSVGPNWGEKSVTSNNNEEWLKGDLLQAHATTGVVSKSAAGSTSTGKFAVAARPKALTDVEGIVLGKDAIDKIALSFTGTVVPNHRVKPSTGTAGKVDSFTDGSTAATLEVGTYVGHVNEVGSGSSLATNAVNTDIGIVEINPSYWL
jgi:hypothetical protein